MLRSSLKDTKKLFCKYMCIVNNFWWFNIVYSVKFIQKVILHETGEINQSVKSLAHKHWKQRSEPWNLCEKLYTVTCLSNPSSGVTEIGRSLEFIGNQMSETDQLKAQWETVSKNKEHTDRENSYHQYLSSTYPCTHTYQRIRD